MFVFLEVQLEIVHICGSILGDSKLNPGFRSPTDRKIEIF
jgi:hypothetical protein